MRRVELTGSRLLMGAVLLSAALTLAVNHSLGQLPSPIEVPAFVVRQCWHERFHGDAANQWLRVLVAELFMEGQPADKA